MSKFCLYMVDILEGTTFHFFYFGSFFLVSFVFMLNSVTFLKLKPMPKMQRGKRGGDDSYYFFGKSLLIMPLVTTNKL